MEYKTISNIPGSLRPGDGAGGKIKRAPGAPPPGGAGQRPMPDGTPQGRFRDHPVRDQPEALRLPGPDPHRGHQPEAGPAGATPGKWGQEPVLLLDDVLSELDAGRQDFVLNQIVKARSSSTCREP